MYKKFLRTSILVGITGLVLSGLLPCSCQAVYVELDRATARRLQSVVGIKVQIRLTGRSFDYGIPDLDAQTGWSDLPPITQLPPQGQYLAFPLDDLPPSWLPTLTEAVNTNLYPDITLNLYVQYRQGGQLLEFALGGTSYNRTNLTHLEQVIQGARALTQVDG
jgi:hypothetical protein